MYSTLTGRFLPAIAALIAAVISPALFGDELYFESRDISALTVPSVRDIVEDNLGYIWAATPGGVIQYDGFEYHLWDRERFDQIGSERSDLLPSEDITSLEYDGATNTLWIGTDSGLVGYDLFTQTLEAVNYSLQDKKIVNQQILDVEISLEGQLFSLTHDGVYSRNSDGDMIEVDVLDDAGDQSEASVTELGSDCLSGLWAVNSEGLKSWNPAENRFEHVLDIPGLMDIECIGAQLWLGISGAMVYRYDPKTGNLHSYSVPGPMVDFVEGPDGQVWMASEDSGLIRYSLESDTFEICPIDTEHPYRLQSGKISSLHAGAQQVWVGSNDTGLYSVDSRKNNNLDYTRRSGSNSLPNGPINSVREDSLGYLWVGSSIGGLARVNPVTGEVRPYLHDPGDYFSIGSNHITSILEDRTGRIWVGTDEGPALYISEIEGFEPPDLMVGGWPDLSGRSVLAMAESGDGSIWMSLRDGGLFRFDPRDRDFDMFPFTSSSVPKVLHTDRFGSLWAGSRTDLQLYRNDGYLVKTWDLESGNESPQLAAGVAAIYSDSRDRNWFGGPSGLVVYDADKEEFSPVTLPEDKIFGVTGIVEDPRGNIWVADDRELHIFDSERRFVLTIGDSAGFTPGGFISELRRSLNGDILVGAHGELWSFDDLPSIISETLPPVHIVSVQIAGNKPVSGGEVMRQGVLDIRSDQNNLTIEFGSVSYESNKDLSYQYRLEGVDKEWLLSDGRRLIHYANLPFRDMAFHVRSYNTRTGFQGMETSLAVNVDKPIWRRWWVILLYVAAVAALVALLIRLREGELLRGQIQALEEARSEALKANQQLEILTMKDTLSGLLNRRGFDRAIEHAINTASRNDLMISLFMMDVDYFKRYNDNYGHVQGDEVLRAVGRALKSVFGRSTDIIARYGGEEFTVVFIGVNPEAMVILANELLMAIEKLDIVHDYSGASNRLTLSVGSATIQAKDDLTEECIVGLSDKALYMAKNNGRKRVCFAGIVPGLPEKMDNGTKPLVLNLETAE